MALYLLKQDIQKAADPIKGKFLQRFFKTGKGQYAEGDVFLGLTVPQSRVIAKKYRFLPLSSVQALLKSKIHEERLIALLILVDRFATSDEEGRKRIYTLYLASTRWINNWDLVDTSADKIVGRYIFEHPKERHVLKTFAKSPLLWERRIAIIATFWCIKQGRFDDTLQIAKILLSDTHDLIHKAVGWMLREVGKRSLQIEKDFLLVHYKRMPRTSLRYAIEHFPPAVRKQYLRGQV